MKLAIISTHPIQYYAPLFRLLSSRNNIAVKVFYTWEKDAALYDKDFVKSFKWDIPLLEGYDYRFVSNNGSLSKSFWGVKNPGLNREIEEWGADALLVFGWNYYSHFKALRYFSGKIPVLFRGDSTLLDENPGIKRIARRLFLRWVFSHVDTALYVGANNKNYFSAHGLREHQLVFGPHAIDNRRFEDTDGMYEQEALNRRRELGIPDEDIVWLFVGKFQEKKDPLLLIRAFKKLEAPHASLLLVGDGVLMDALQAEAGNHKKIHFLPFQNQSKMPVIYRMGDIFCLPSKGPAETWGLAVNEAMACKKPILVSDRCGCASDLVFHDVNGFIFAAGDIGQLLEKMKAFSGNKAALKAMGENSFGIIQNWSYDRLAPIIEKLMITGHAQ